MKTADRYRAELDPKTGKWTAIWPDGRSSGWKTREQAERHARSYKP